MNSDTLTQMPATGFTPQAIACGPEQAEDEPDERASSLRTFSYLGAGRAATRINITVQGSLVCTPEELDYARNHVHKLLGIGASSAVFEFSGQDGRKRALKAIPARPGVFSTEIGRHLPHSVIAKRPVMFETIQQEIEALDAAKECPATVNLEAVAHSPTTFYLVTDIVPGKSLESQIRPLRSAPIETRVEVATNVLRAVASLHEHNVAHMDIKPANIQVDELLNARLVDLGFGRRCCDDQVTSGDIVGTRYFMPPEMLIGGNYNPKKADCFSLGLVLFEILEGHRPFLSRDTHGQEVHACLLMRCGCTINFSKTPKAWRPVILEMLQLPAAKRISAKDALARITALTQKQAVAVEVGCHPCTVQ